MVKLLSSSIKSSSAIVKTSNISKSLVSIKKDTKVLSGSLVKELLIIKEKTISIDKLLSKNLLLDQKKLKDRINLSKKDRFKKREDDLEKKDEKLKDPKESGGSAPRLGFLDSIKRFIFFTIFGYIGSRLIKHLPAILDFIQKLNPVIKTIETIIGTLFDGFVTFIDLGYKAYDTVRSFAKNLGGEDFLKIFDQFSSALNTFINLAILVGLSTLGGSDFGLGEDDDFCKPKRRRGKRGRRRVTKGRGGKPGRRFGRRPKVTQGKGGGNFLQRLFGKAKGFKFPKVKLPKIPALSQVGKSLGPLAKLGKFGKAIPGLATVIGVTEGLSRLGEGDYTGALLSFGSAIPIAGWGFLAIDIAREMMGKKSFDSAVGGAFGGTPGLTDKQREQRVPTQGKSALESSLTTMSGPSVMGFSSGGFVGGVISRGGQTVGGSIGRTERKVTERGEKLPQKVEVTPGKSVGGEEEFQKLFPKSEKNDRSSPFDYLKNSANKMAEVKYLGPLFGLVSKIILGEDPQESDYKNVGIGLNAFIQSGFNKGGLKGSITSGFAEGGSVEAMRMSGNDISLWAEESVKDLVESKINTVRKETIHQLTLKNRELKMQLQMKEKDEAEGEDPSLEVGPGGAGGTVTGGNADFWSLVAIASLESGNAQGRADVAQSIYNRLASGIYSGKTIKELIVSGNGRQYQPVGRAVREFRAINDKQSAINAVMAANKLSRTQAEKFINDTAMAVQNKDLQKSAAEFVGGRTDFWAQGLTPPADGVGYVVRHGHRFGWFVGPAAIAYGKKNPGPARAPKLGDVVIHGGGGGGDVGLGKGYGSQGRKIAGELGRFMKRKGVVPGSIHRHPEHPPYSLTSGHSRGSLHYQGRAIDLGAYANEQGPVLKAVAEFNRLHKVKPVQLLHAGNEPRGHSDHVHVAYQGGGLVGGKNIKTPSVNSYASYNTPGGQSVTYVQTIFVEKPAQMQPQKRGSTMFPGDMVNNNALHKKAALIRG